MEIKSYESFGILTLGDTKQLSRKKLGGSFIEFQKSPFDEKNTDAFQDKGFHLYYDADDKLEFIEAFAPADVSFRGVKFLEREIDEVLSDMIALGQTVNEFEDGVFIFFDAGISAYAPDGIVETISVFRQGYYDFMIEEN